MSGIRATSIAGMIGGATSTPRRSAYMAIAQKTLESGAQKARRHNAVAPSSFGVPTLEILGVGEDTIEPYSSTVDESSAASLCRSC
jgi:hypothetical protein